jgi:PKD repeat protein
MINELSVPSARPTTPGPGKNFSPSPRLALNLLTLFLLARAATAQVTQVVTPFDITSLELRNGTAVVHWRGGAPTNQVQCAPSMNGPWQDLGPAVAGGSCTNPVPMPQAFFRVMALQPSPVCNFVLNPASVSPGVSGGTGVVTVNAPNGCPWVASSASPWIHSSASDNGSGRVNYTIDPNPGPNPRTGTINVADQTCAISQAANQPPIAKAGPDTTVVVGTSAAFSGTSSSDPDGTISAYAWDFGDGTSASGASVSHAYVVAGSYTVRLTVTDDLGATGTDTAEVTVNNVSAVSGEYLWAKDLRGNGVTDTARINGVAVDHQGNSIVVGTFTGTINFGGTSLSSAGGQDAFVAKYSGAGALQWAKRYGDVYDQGANAVSVDSANNILVVGSFAGTLTFGGGVLTEVPTPSFYYSQTDIFVAKLSPSGSHVWSRSFGSSGTEAAYGVTVDGSDNVTLTGNFAIPPTATQLDFGGGPLGNAGAQDMFVAKLAGADGSYRWAVHHGNTDGTYSYAVYANGISSDRNGDVAVVGYFSGGTLNLGGGNRAGAGGADLFVAKYSGTTGAHLWSKTIGSSGSEVAKGVAIDTNNNVIITGGFNGTVDFGGTLLTAPQATGIFVAKYSSAGGLVWAKGFGGNYWGQDIGYGVAVDQSGNIGVAGTVQGSYVDFGGGPFYSDGTLNVFVAKLSANGGYVWARRLKTGSTLNYGWAAAFDSTGNLFAGGYFGGTIDFGGGSLMASASMQDGFLVKYAP